MSTIRYLIFLPVYMIYPIIVVIDDDDDDDDDGYNGNHVVI